MMIRYTESQHGKIDKVIYSVLLFRRFFGTRSPSSSLSLCFFFSGEDWADNRDQRTTILSR